MQMNDLITYLLQQLQHVNPICPVPSQGDSQDLNLYLRVGGFTLSPLTGVTVGNGHTEYKLASALQRSDPPKTVQLSSNSTKTFPPTSSRQSRSASTLKSTKALSSVQSSTASVGSSSKSIDPNEAKQIVAEVLKIKAAGQTAVPASTPVVSKGDDGQKIVLSPEYTVTPHGPTVYPSKSLLNTGIYAHPFSRFIRYQHGGAIPQPTPSNSTTSYPISEVSMANSRITPEDAAAMVAAERKNAIPTVVSPEEINPTTSKSSLQVSFHVNSNLLIITYQLNQTSFAVVVDPAWAELLAHQVNKRIDGIFEDNNPCEEDVYRYIVGARLNLQGQTPTRQHVEACFVSGLALYLGFVVGLPNVDTSSLEMLDLSFLSYILKKAKNSSTSSGLTYGKPSSDPCGIFLQYQSILILDLIVEYLYASHTGNNCQWLAGILGWTRNWRDVIVEAESSESVHDPLDMVNKNNMDAEYRALHSIVNGILTRPIWQARLAACRAQ